MSEEQNCNVEENSSEEHHIRVAKAYEMRQKGVEPWPSKKDVKNTAKQVLDEFKEDSEQEYTVAGRLVALRQHGKTAFAHLKDRTGKIQIYLRADKLGEDNFKQLEHQLDLGDIVWVKGVAFKTKTGEVTIKAQEIELISKCLHPLPEKFHGLTHVEARYRQRYLDLISNSDSAERFKKRSKIISIIRHYLEEHDFIEVETPMLHPIPGGATAKPFVTHHNALDMELFLRIAPELYLKRLVVGGFERVFEINRSFRNEGISTKHNPEFTMLEFYMAHEDYKFSMDFVEDMLKTIVGKLGDSLLLQYGDKIIDFSKPFKRMSVKQSVIEVGGFTEDNLSEEGVDKIIAKHSIKLKRANASLGEKIFELFEYFVEDKLIQPTFITDYPIEVSPLAKRHSDDPSLAARYELFIAGMEFANSFNELNDPFDQAERFKHQAACHKDGDDEAHKYDADYIKALEYGLPPTVGTGIGIDRLTMILTNTPTIKDVILFPTLKKEHKE
jgi:lysyl-tRNA synthetase, class II